MNSENFKTPIVKSLARQITAEELVQVSGAGTKVVIKGPKDTEVVREETYPPGSEEPTMLDTIIETP